MEARLASHKATASVENNHFSRSDIAARKRIVEPDDPAARLERELQAMLTNARTAGRAMARYALYLRALGKVYITDKDIVEMIGLESSVWMRQRWAAGLVHPELVLIARGHMLKLLRERGWSL